MICIMLLMVQTPVSLASEKDASEESLVMSEETAGGIITDFKDPAETVFWFEGEPTEQKLVAGLPAHLDAEVIPEDQDSAKGTKADSAKGTKTDSAKGTKTDSAKEKVSVRIPVTWEIVEDYGKTEYYFYSARPVLPKKYQLAKDLDPDMDVPWITLFRKASPTQMDEGEPETEIPVEKPQKMAPVYTEAEGSIPAEESLSPQEEGAEGSSVGGEDGDSINGGNTDSADSKSSAGGEGGKSINGTCSACKAFSSKASNGTEMLRRLMGDDGKKGSKAEEAASSTKSETGKAASDSKQKSAAKKSGSRHAGSTQKKIYNYLTKKMGLNMAAACAVMTNLYAESGMQPNNLENTYNARFGLSDSQYTSRVNKGKKHNGRYKTSSGSTRYFTRDYCGYGICQWTSLNRRKNLLKKAVKDDVSIGDLEMQLEFLKYELKNSYPQVWATLKGVPNNARGVYLAAMHFCISFEVPANTNATAASRARTALATYWKTYSGKSASVRGRSYLGLCGYSYPKSVKKGVGVTCGGHVISNYTIRKVSARIVTAKGRAVCRSTKRPGTNVYSLYNFDRSMTFSKLSPGSYIYIIRAKDSHGRSVKVEHAFRVSEGGKTIVSRGCAVRDITASSSERQ